MVKKTLKALRCSTSSLRPTTLNIHKPRHIGKPAVIANFQKLLNELVLRTQNTRIRPRFCNNSFTRYDFSFHSLSLRVRWPGFESSWVCCRRNSFEHEIWMSTLRLNPSQRAFVCRCARRFCLSTAIGRIFSVVYVYNSNGFHPPEAKDYL